jgi:hypothetical protein
MLAASVHPSCQYPAHIGRSLADRVRAAVQERYPEVKWHRIRVDTARQTGSQRRCYMDAVTIASGGRRATPREDLALHDHP